MSGSKAVLGYGAHRSFPTLLIQALACGKPVITDSLFAMEYLPKKGVYYASEKTHEHLNALIGQLDAQLDQMEAKELRSQVMSYHLASFRGKMLKQVEKTLHS